MHFGDRGDGRAISLTFGEPCIHEQSVDTTLLACAATFDQATALTSEGLLDVVVFAVVDEDFDDGFGAEVDISVDFVVVDGSARFAIAVLHFGGYADVQKACATG